MSRLCYIIITILVHIVVPNNCAIIHNNVVPDISNSDDLISSIASNCFDRSYFMHCLKEKVLTYLDTISGTQKGDSRSLTEDNIDEKIFNRIATIFSTNEFNLRLPKTFFQDTTITYKPDNGLDLEIPTIEGRGHLLKKKLLFPVLLLLKLKMKALMPILVALIGLKAMKALILSKIAITLVLGFLIAQLAKKVGMKMPMTMNPMQMMQPPAPEYGAPIPTTGTPSASYETSNGWEASNYNSRVWEPSSSSHGLAYNSYYSPSSSSSLTGTSYLSGTGSYSSYSAPASAPTSSAIPSSSAPTQSSSATSAHSY